jgi:hypothetical protein
MTYFVHDVSDLPDHGFDRPARISRRGPEPAVIHTKSRPTY